MKNTRYNGMRAASVSVALVLAPRAVLACPVCFGQSDSPMASAINLGVILMLGIVVTVLGGFASFIVHLSRRARLVAGSAATAPPLRPGDAETYLPSNPQEGTAQC